MNENGKPASQPAQPPQLLITLHPNGSIQVQGAIHDKILAYGLLECARDALQEHFTKAAQSKIVPAQMADPFLMKKSH